MAKIWTDEEVWEAYQSEGSAAGAARKLGGSIKPLERRIRRMKARAARRGHSPEHDFTHSVPEGYLVKGTSTLYDEEGKPRLQWVKSNIDHERQQELLREAYAAMGEEIPRESRVKAPRATDADLLNVFVVTDYHFGALAWHEETRDEDWDLGIAEDLLVDWFASAIDASPQAATAIFAELGDYQHFDSLESVTPTNRHILDSDTRFAKMVRVVIRATRRVIRMLLEKHSHVHVITAEGNHNIASSVWMREWLAAIYEDEPRVTVDTSPDPYYCYEHGDTSVFFHHGHLTKMDAVDEVFASKFREVFGRTRFSYAHTGHLHHKRVKESSLMETEQHQTLAAKDAHASRHGYSAARSAQVITYHKHFGEVGRVRFTPDMVRAA